MSKIRGDGSEIPESMMNVKIGETNDQKKMRMMAEPIKEFDITLGGGEQLLTFLTMHGNQAFIVKRVGQLIRIWTIGSPSPGP